MIVDTMTHGEVYAELARDREHLARWWVHRRDGLRRRALKASRFPLLVWGEYVSPRKVRYLCLTWIGGRRYEKSNASSVLALCNSSFGIYVYVSWLPGMNIVPTMFTPHFFQRYGERLGVEKSGLDLIRHFFERNQTSRDVIDERFMGKSVRWKGYDCLSICVSDGVCMGDVKDGVCMMRTFITYEMASGIQAGEYGAARKMLRTTEEMVNERLRLS